ncbi:hypothetical protein [Enterobacter asburiae]|uniref:hypothetical protein n=1 Tax=Enterobacter asburiae TaxID=61645 RepID=UPI0015762EC4|nr:hypothetical protein [Enterobacter asburiae]NQF31028.1 hypothetical protein [Enterobacter asburiae]
MDLSTVTRLRSRALKAYEEALDAQSLGMNGRNVTRQNIDALFKEFQRWDSLYQSLTRGRRQHSLVTFRRCR